MPRMRHHTTLSRSYLALLLIAVRFMECTAGFQISAYMLSPSIVTTGLDKNEALLAVRLAGNVPESVIGLLDSNTMSAEEFPSITALPSKCLLSTNDLGALLSNVIPQLGPNLLGGPTAPVILVRLGATNPFRNIAFTVHPSRKSSLVANLRFRCPSFVSGLGGGPAPLTLGGPAPAPAVLPPPGVPSAGQGLSQSSSGSFGVATAFATSGPSSQTPASGSVTTSSVSLVASPGSSTPLSAQGQGSSQAQVVSGSLSVGGTSGSQVGRGGAGSAQSATLGVNASGPSQGSARTQSRADSPDGGEPAESDSSADFTSTQGPVSVAGSVDSQAQIGTDSG